MKFDFIEKDFIEAVLQTGLKFTECAKASCPFHSPTNVLSPTTEYTTCKLYTWSFAQCLHFSLVNEPHFFIKIKQKHAVVMFMTYHALITSKSYAVW